jgi:hypothetical protein
MRLFLCFLTIFFVVSSVQQHGLIGAAHSAGYCPGQPGGKCPPNKKPKGLKRSDYSPEERKQILENARQVCIKEYGAGSSIHRFDWSRNTVICKIPGQ